MKTEIVYKAIEIDTSHNFKKGELFYPDRDGSFYFYNEDDRRIEFNPKDYPHLFKKIKKTKIINQ